MNVKDFIENFIEHNTLIRLWYKTGTGHEEVITGDKPMMEHQLIKSNFAAREVVGVTDIYYHKSHYVEAVNLIKSETFPKWFATNFLF